MTNEEILRKAIEKAGTYWLPKHKEPLAEYVEFLLGDNEYYSIIFSHDFAKAFWGEEVVSTGFFEEKIENRQFVYVPFKEPIWKTHLTIMVLEDDPIKYLEQFI